jgi:DNA-binding IclR family transcriptional regulator
LPKPAYGKNYQNRSVATSFLKGLDLMTVLARRREGLPIGLIVRKLQLPRTSVLRMLTTLEQYGLVAKKGRLWCCTEQFYEWTLRDTHAELKQRYAAVVHAVAGEVGELVELAIGEVGGVRYIHAEQPGHLGAVSPLKSAIYPLHKTAAGKLLLSQRADLGAGLANERQLAEIAEARVTGVAMNRRESDPNVVAVATWVARPSPLTPIICVKWPFHRFTEQKAERALAAIRQALARAKI